MTIFIMYAQVAAMKAKGKTGRRWHPLFIRWCLNIALASPKTYDIIQDSGFVTLPSKRTLRDYTHWFKSKPGFQVEVDKFLREEAKVEELEGWKRYACMCVWGRGGGACVCAEMCRHSHS